MLIMVTRELQSTGSRNLLDTLTHVEDIALQFRIRCRPPTRLTSTAHFYTCSASLRRATGQSLRVDVKIPKLRDDELIAAIEWARSDAEDDFCPDYVRYADYGLAASQHFAPFR